MSRRWSWFGAAVLLTLGADQALKAWVLAHLPYGLAGQPFVTLPGTQLGLALSHAKNEGAAWSMLWGHQGLLIAVGVAFCIGLLAYVHRLEARARVAELLALGALWGGAVGNLLDRARLGHVVDMFDLQSAGQHLFPVFNVADVGIDGGVAVLLLLAFLPSQGQEAQGA